LLIVAALILTAYMVFCLLEGRYWRALSWVCFLVITALTFITVDVRSLAARLRRLFLVAALVAMILDFVTRR
jgi:branched-subunit amino acid transport protein